MVKNMAMAREEFPAAGKQVSSAVLTDVVSLTRALVLAAGKDCSAEASEWHLSKGNLIPDRKKASTAKKCCL